MREVSTAFKFWFEKRERDHLVELGVNGRTLLKWIMDTFGMCELY
jgi:hypothetical protein